MSLKISVYRQENAEGIHVSALSFCIWIFWTLPFFTTDSKNRGITNCCGFLVPPPRPKALEALHLNIWRYPLKATSYIHHHANMPILKTERQT